MIATKGELMFQILEKGTTITVKDVSSGGAKIEANAQGKVSGRYDAVHFETADVHIKPDGTNEWEVRGYDITTKGELVSITGKGIGRQVTPNTGRFEGDIELKTSGKGLDWLNSTKFWCEGTNDLATSEVEIKIYAKK